MYLPTYKQLPSYEGLIAKGDGSETLMYPEGGIPEDTKAIETDIERFHGQVKKLAQWLKADTVEQSAYNVWHFIKYNINYEVDPLGWQKIRSPYNIYRNREEGVDCKSMAVMGFCLLYEMGYKPELIEVAFSDPAFTHIFARVNGYVIDAVPTMEFNRYAHNITRQMRISLLNGLPDSTMQLAGLGAATAADATTQKLQALLNSKKLSRKEADLAKYVILLNGKPERNVVLHIMPYLDRIDSSGQFVFKKNISSEEVDKLMNNIQQEEEKQGLGKIKIGKKLKADVKKVEKKVASAAKKVGTAALKDAEKLGKAVLKYSPLTVAARNSLLLLLDVNFLGFSKKLKYGYLTEDQAKQLNLDADEYHKFRTELKDLQNMYTAIQGSAAKLEASILKGGKGFADGITATGGGLAGLAGPEVAAATAAPFVAKIVAMLGKIDFKKLIALAPKSIQDDIASAETDLKNGGAKNLLSKVIGKNAPGVTSLLNKAIPGPPSNTGNGSAGGNNSGASNSSGTTTGNTSNTNTGNTSSADAGTTTAPAKSSSALPWVAAAGVAAKLLLFS